MKRIIFAVTMSIVLTACSSGGGGSSSNNSATEGINEQLRELKTVNIDGHKIYLTDEQAGFIERDIGTKRVKGFNQAYSYVGYSLPRDVKTGQYGQVSDDRVSSGDMNGGGLQTLYKDIPKSGAAVYNGVAFGANSNGKLEMFADFAGKSVYGNIYNLYLKSGTRLNDISLNKTSIAQYITTDNEAHFAGKASSFTSVPLGYGGTFMGPNAEEVIGVVTDKTNKPYVMFAGARGDITSSPFDGVNVNNALERVRAEIKAAKLAAEREANLKMQNY